MANVRLQVDFDELRMKELEELMKTCNISTKKELLNNAFSLFAWAVREVSRGNTIASVNDSEQIYRELQMPVLNAAARRGIAAAE